MFCLPRGVKHSRFIIEPLVIKEKPHYYDLVYKVVVGGPAMAGTFLAENGFGRTSFSSDYIFFYFLPGNFLADRILSNNIDN